MPCPTDMEPPPMAIYAYLRVSTDRQTDSGAGLAAQRAACLRAAGGALDRVFEDAGVSGAAGLDKRPALLEALANIQAGDVLWVAKRDRLGRDPLVVAMIERAVLRKHARIGSAAGEGTGSDSPADVLMRRIIDAFAEYERLIIGARTKAALRAKQVCGERVGSLPYGYRVAEDGKRLLPDDQEQQVLAVVRTLHQQGQGYSAIARTLATQGWRPRGKGRWHPQTIKNIVRSLA